MVTQYITMLLNGKEKVWQKIEQGEVQIVTSQIVTYVDEFGQEIELSEVYEMTVIDGVARDKIE